MSKISPLKVWLVIASSAVFLLLLLLMPNFNFTDNAWFSMPKKQDFISFEVSKVKTSYGLRKETVFTSVEKVDELEKIPDVFEHGLISSDAKIIHSSDFSNDLILFHSALNSLSGKDSVLRIVHFGDSQIEGDRVTGKLRQSFQDSFGGCGAGFMPISEHRVQRLNVLKYVSGWNRYKVFGAKPTGKHNKYGFLGYYHTMDSVSANASIKMRKRRNYFKGVSRAEKISLLYDAPYEYLGAEVFVNNQSQEFNDEKSLGEVHKRTWLLDSFPEKSLSVKFKADTSLILYGVSLDCKKGVAVDNVGLRGSSGTEFTKINEYSLKSQLALLDAKLIVYQFGVNVIPYVVDDYKFYENTVYRQLMLFKKLSPQSAILVVGVSDMCQKKDGEFKSFPNIKKVILAQRNAAKRAGCAFWDLQKVMGGEGSMKNWVNARPPLGEKDYTHFNRRGANLVGEQLYKALIADFKSYSSMAF